MFDFDFTVRMNRVIFNEVAEYFFLTNCSHLLLVNQIYTKNGHELHHSLHPGLTLQAPVVEPMWYLC